MPLISFLLCCYLSAAVFIAWVAATRGRSAPAWLAIAMLTTPLLALMLLWFLADLAHEQQRTRAFLRDAQQRRRHQYPHDTFSQARERQEQELHDQVITARMRRERGPDVLMATRGLRTREQSASMRVWPR